MKIKISSILYIVFCILLNNCASIYYPTGGPIDVDAPIIINKEHLFSNNTKLKDDQPIEFIFNERIHPKTINQIRVEPETDIKIKHKGNILSIKPNNKWPQTFRLIFDRSLSDYFSNNLDATETFLFSLNDSILLNNIEGSLFNFDNNKIYEIAIIDTNYIVQSKTQSDINGNFIFKGIELDSSFFMLAIENYISEDFKNQIRFQNYAISNREIGNKNNHLFISSPIERSEIDNINFINNKYGIIEIGDSEPMDLFLNDTYFSDKFIDSKMIFIDYDFKDSIEVKIKLTNKIEEYFLSSFLFLNKTNDTINPKIKEVKMTSNQISDSTLISKIDLELSEPIKILNDGTPFSVFYNDSINLNINYKYKNPMKISLDLFEVEIDTTINDSSFSLSGDCYNIFDLSNNNLCDSILDIELLREWDNSLSLINALDSHEQDFIDYGIINGNINYSDSNNLIIVPINVSDNEKKDLGKKIKLIYEYKNIINNENNKTIYPFEIALPIDGSLNYIDYYSILSYEDINPVSKFYFSGTLEPLQLAAKFNYYDKILSIRGNWINTVDLKFK